MERAVVLPRLRSTGSRKLPSFGFYVYGHPTPDRWGFWINRVQRRVSVAVAGYALTIRNRP